MDEHAGHRQRLRERFEKAGLDSFQPHEVLELLLTYSIPRKDTNEIAHRLIRRFGSVPAVLEASREELSRVEGVGEQSAHLISLMLPLFRRYRQEKAEEKLPVMDRPEKVKEYCASLYRDMNRETFFVLSLDAQLHCLGVDSAATGTVDRLAVSPREVMDVLLRRHATQAIISHNHPGGGEKPSREDMELTRTLYAILRSVDIRLVDHIIVAGDRGISFHDLGLMPGEDG